MSMRRTHFRAKLYRHAYPRKCLIATTPHGEVLLVAATHLPVLGESGWELRSWVRSRGVLPLLIVIVGKPSIFLALFSTIVPLAFEQHGCGWAERQFMRGVGRCHYGICQESKGDRWHYQVK